MADLDGLPGFPVCTMGGFLTGSDYVGITWTLASGQPSEELQASFEPFQLSWAPQKALHFAATAAVRVFSDTS